MPNITKNKKLLNVFVRGVLCTSMVATLGLGACNGNGEESSTSSIFTSNSASETPDKSIAKVIILAGQSNMEGWTHTEYARENLDAIEYVTYNEGADNVKIAHRNKQTAVEENPFESVRFGQGVSDTTFGPEIGIANYLMENDSDTDYYLIKYAIGGAGLGLSEHFLSPSAGGFRNLYTEMVRYVKDCLEYLENSNIEFEITAFCWMQGETDALDGTLTAAYKENLKCFIFDMREDFDEWSAFDGIKFIDAEISQHWKNYRAINQVKREISLGNDLNLYFETINEGLTFNKEPMPVDNAHYDSLSMIKLGQLFGENILKTID